MDRLSGNYIRGFTEGIKTVEEQFDIICDDLRRHNKIMTSKKMKEFLRCCLINRELLREFDDSFIRWNCITNKFEIWREKWSKYKDYKEKDDE